MSDPKGTRAELRAQPKRRSRRAKRLRFETVPLPNWIAAWNDPPASHVWFQQPSANICRSCYLHTCAPNVICMFEALKRSLKRDEGAN
jgi:hypothetical protein